MRKRKVMHKERSVSRKRRPMGVTKKISEIRILRGKRTTDLMRKKRKGESKQHTEERKGKKHGSKKREGGGNRSARPVHDFLKLEKPEQGKRSRIMTQHPGKGEKYKVVAQGDVDRRGIINLGREIPIKKRKGYSFPLGRKQRQSTL